MINWQDSDTNEKNWCIVCHRNSVDVVIFVKIIIFGRIIYLFVAHGKFYYLLSHKMTHSFSTSSPLSMSVYWNESNYNSNEIMMRKKNHSIRMMHAVRPPHKITELLVVIVCVGIVGAIHFVRLSSSLFTTKILPVRFCVVRCRFALHSDVCAAVTAATAKCNWTLRLFFAAGGRKGGGGREKRRRNRIIGGHTCCTRVVNARCGCRRPFNFSMCTRERRARLTASSFFIAFASLDSLADKHFH